ncbi:hypothetical protein QR680_004933 [Steinernema hermaphroditum]|uniref:Uncharacterized protein n=1 Tax=Steinernema hermaphroditum TaxID=289476 RepID=A0AA39HRI7_9BILA|nr:hypothetical protein QR680_004933 [Steinernema hermaphroditum]
MKTCFEYQPRGERMNPVVHELLTQIVSDVVLTLESPENIPPQPSDVPSKERQTKRPLEEFRQNDSIAETAKKVKIM